MTGPELNSRLLKRLGEDPALPRFFTSAHAYAALNEAQQFFVLLTLCLEAEVTLPVSGFELDARTTAANWLVCLALRRSDGTKIQPATLGAMAARDPFWQSSTGAIQRYATAGFSTLFVSPWGVTNVTATYARGPVLISASVDPEIPEEYQPCLLDYAQVRLRLHQGAQLLAADMPLLNSFMEAVTKCAAYVRARSLDLRYDVLPPEVKMPDWSRVLGKPKAAKSE